MYFTLVKQVDSMFVLKPRPGGISLATQEVKDLFFERAFDLKLDEFI